MKITWLGESGFVLESNNTRLLLDPLNNGITGIPEIVSGRKKRFVMYKVLIPEKIADEGIEYLKSKNYEIKKRSNDSYGYRSSNRS